MHAQRPGKPGISETIRVISIVGRFLEHSRVFYFANNGQPELYLSSADLMSRNLDRRVELMFPIEGPVLVQQVKDEALDTALADQVRARILAQDGSYTRIALANGEQQDDSQTLIARSRTKRFPPTHFAPREAP